VRTLDALRTVDASDREVRALTRDGIRQALLAHAGLWDAQSTNAAARLTADRAAQFCAEVERKMGLGAVSALDVELARVDRDDAALALDTAAAGLLSAKDAVARYGLTGDAEPGVLRFLLAEALVADAPAVRESIWSLDLARARAQQAHRDMRPAFGVDGTYIGNTQISAGLSSRGPSATATMGYPSLYDPTFLLYGNMKGWQLTFKLDLPLDPAGRAAAKVADADARLAAARLHTQTDDTTQALARTLREARAAEASLGLAEQRSTLAARKARLVAAQADAGGAGPLAVLDARAQAVTAEATRAKAWAAYVTAVGSYLDLTNGTWEVRP
jgi:outer membrane protein TolC